MLNFVHIGIGQCGNRFAEQFGGRNRTAIAINTARVDMSGLDNKSISPKNQLHIALDGLKDGAGRDPEIGRRSMEANLDMICEAVIRATRDKPADRIVLWAGLGGGTGTGGVLPLMKRLTDDGYNFLHALPYADGFILYLMTGKMPLIRLAPGLNVLFESIRSEADIYPFACHECRQLLLAGVLLFAQFFGFQDFLILRQPALIFSIMFEPVQQVHGMADYNVVTFVHQGKTLRKEFVSLLSPDYGYCDCIHVMHLSSYYHTRKTALFPKNREQC